jgi:26S proteasome regulatory subunit T2
MSVGTLEEIIDENHAIVSSAMGPEYYVGQCSTALSHHFQAY